MIRETKLLGQRQRRRVLEEVETEFPNANELQLEEETDSRMKDYYVDTFIQLCQNNISFCSNLFNSDLGQRILERKEHLINQEDVDPDDEQSLLLDSVELCREDIEELF